MQDQVTTLTHSQNHTIRIGVLDKHVQNIEINTKMSLYSNVYEDCSLVIRH